MIQRICFGAIAIAVLIVMFWADWKLGKLDLGDPMVSRRYSGMAIAILFLPFLIMGYLEFAKMANSLGIKVLRGAGLFGTVLLAFQPLILNYLGSFLEPLQFRYMAMDALGNVHFLLSGILAIAFLEQMVKYRLADGLRQIACTMLGVMYLGICGGLLLNMRMMGSTATAGLAYLVAFVIVVKITDIGAYFTGSFFGKHKLIPWLSPGKSWEGLIGGLLIAAGAGVIYWRMGVGWEGFNFPPCAPQTWWLGALFGLSLGMIGQFADLCESLLKRSANIKDSGALLPQFGGILDMIDSPLIAAPLGYLWMIIFNDQSLVF